MKWCSTISRCQNSSRSSPTVSFWTQNQIPGLSHFLGCVTDKFEDGVCVFYVVYSKLWADCKMFQTQGAASYSICFFCGVILLFIRSCQISYQHSLTALSPRNCTNSELSWGCMMPSFFKKKFILFFESQSLGGWFAHFKGYRSAGTTVVWSSSKCNSHLFEICQCGLTAMCT